jgi:hypothetical protein
VEAVWFLLVGVLVAQGLQFIREIVIERRREAQAIRAEQVKEDREALIYARTSRQARRLVADELDTTANHLETLGRRASFPPTDVVERERLLDASEWEKHKGALAEALDDDAQFDVLSSFQYGARQLRERLRGAGPGTLIFGEEMLRLHRMELQARVMELVVLGEAGLPPEWEHERADLRAKRLKRARDLVDQFDLKPIKDPMSS